MELVNAKVLGGVLTIPFLLCGATALGSVLPWVEVDAAWLAVEQAAGYEFAVGVEVIVLSVAAAGFLAAFVWSSQIWPGGVAAGLAAVISAEAIAVAVETTSHGSLRMGLGLAVTITCGPLLAMTTALLTARASAERARQDQQAQTAGDLSFSDGS